MDEINKSKNESGEKLEEAVDRYERRFYEETEDLRRRNRVRNWNNWYRKAFLKD